MKGLFVHISLITYIFLNALVEKLQEQNSGPKCICL